MMHKTRFMNNMTINDTDTQYDMQIMYLFYGLIKARK